MTRAASLATGVLLSLGPALGGARAQTPTAVRQTIEGLGLSIATPDDARRILGLKGGSNVAF